MTIDGTVHSARAARPPKGHQGGQAARAAKPIWAIKVMFHIHYLHISDEKEYQSKIISLLYGKIFQSDE